MSPTAMSKAPTDHLYWRPHRSPPLAMIGMFYGGGFLLVGVVVGIVTAIASSRKAHEEEDQGEALETWLQAQLSGREELPKSPPEEDE